MDYIAELRERTVFTPLKGKAAYLTDWQKSPKSRGEIPDGENVGLLLEHAELTDVDLDSLEAQWTGRVFLPTDTLAAGRGGKIRRYLYECAAENRTFKDLSGDVLLEVRHKGKQFMRPPSTHPNGERIEWIKDVCPLPLPTKSASSRPRPARS